MKHPLFRAALCAAIFPLVASANSLAPMDAAARPTWSRWQGGGGYVGGTPTVRYDATSRYHAEVDPGLDNWMYPLLTQLIKDLMARNGASAGNLFITMEAGLQTRRGYRYEDARSRLIQAKDHVRQGYYQSASSIVQLLLNDLRSSGSRYQQIGYPQPGYTQPGYTQPGYTRPPQWGGRPDYGSPPSGLRGRFRQVIHTLRDGDLWGARQDIRELIQQVRVRSPDRYSMRPLIRSLRFVAHNLSPGNEHWAIRELRRLRREFSYLV